MSRNRNRRRFLADVGAGLVVASLGPVMAQDLGIDRALTEVDPVPATDDRLTPLVDLILETPPAKLQPMLVKRLKSGALDLQRIVAACAVANAIKFNGYDYDGYHGFMALDPALQMSKELDATHAPLPVLKVVWRNAARIQKLGGASSRRQHTIPAGALSGDGGIKLRNATRAQDIETAEKLLASGAKSNAARFDLLQPTIQDGTDVHRVVLAWRSYEMIRNAGDARGLTLLRQCAGFAVDRTRMDKHNHRSPSPVRKLVPALIAEFGLEDFQPGKRVADDRWVTALGRAIYDGTPANSARLVARALKAGYGFEDVGAAASLASNELILRQVRDRRGNLKVHGASRGVHATDATNAWRNIARVSKPRHAAASLMIAAYHACKDGLYRGTDALPHAKHLAAVTTQEPAKLLDRMASCIRDQDHGGTTAAIHRYLGLGHDEAALRAKMIPFALADDGSLHHEKYWRTLREETAAARPAHRPLYYASMGRVLASGYGVPAPGVAEARALLGV
ncbi:MAG: hypothetical protein CMJ83_01815 [Planctomycetes bacterium]|nr:hypothetical protein [Planctomycetota bacterium]